MGRKRAANEMPFVVDSVSRLRGGILNQKIVYVPPQYVRMHAGVRYLVLRKTASFMRTLLLIDNGPEKAELPWKFRRGLAHTDVIEQLQKARAYKVDRMITEMRSENGGAQKKRVKLVERAELPNICTISAPQIGHIASIEMRVEVSSHVNHNVAIELTEANVSYLIDACRFQIEHCDIHRISNTQQRRARSTNHDDAATDGPPIDDANADEATDELSDHNSDTAESADLDDNIDVGATDNLSPATTPMKVADKTDKESAAKTTQTKLGMFFSPKL